MRISSLKTKITTSRFAETRDFYIACFGMHILEQWSEGDDVGCVLALATECREALIEIKEGPQPGDFSGLGLQFRTEDLAAFSASLPPGIQTSGPTKRPWGSTYLYLGDPNGISLIVYEERA